MFDFQDLFQWDRFITPTIINSRMENFAARAPTIGDMTDRPRLASGTPRELRSRVTPIFASTAPSRTPKELNPQAMLTLAERNAIAHMRHANGSFRSDESRSDFMRSLFAGAPALAVYSAVVTRAAYRGESRYHSRLSRFQLLPNRQKHLPHRPMAKDTADGGNRSQT